MLEKVVAAISEQQKGKEETAVFMVGEQLKDICRSTPGAAELVLKDLEIPEMSIGKCEKKIKALADERHKKNKGNCAFVSPLESDKIIREFYGIAEAAEAEPRHIKPIRGRLIDIDSFL